MRTPFVIIALLLCAFVPLALAGGEEEGTHAATTSVDAIAKRVERIRGLRFKQLPEPLEVTADEARAEALDVLDRDYPPDLRAADEDLYELLGLLPAGTDMRAVYGTIYGSAVGGYYDPADGRLRVVSGGGTANDVVREVTLAHELDHALEDQALGLDNDAASATDDPGLAYKALVEGTATALMFTYLERHFPPDVGFVGLLGSGLGGGATGPDVPAFINAGLIFPYDVGQTFVSALHERGGWALVDEATTDRPPVSTEQVLHPQKWIDREDPDPVTLPRPPAGWERLGGGTFGEWQTDQWLRQAGPPATEVAAGWGGDRYGLYGRGEERLLIMRFRWDTPRDAREFRERLPAALAERGGGAAAFAATGDAVTVVFAPTRALATRLANGAGG